MSTTTPLTVPPSAELRAQIRDRTQELRALRKLLRLAEAAECAAEARARRQGGEQEVPRAS